MGDSGGQGLAAPLSVDEAIRERKNTERLMMARNLELAADSNFNYEIQEMPTWNPNLPKEAQMPVAYTEGYGVDGGTGTGGGIPDAAVLPDMMPELYISDPVMRKPSGTGLGPPRAAAGVSSHSRHYKMASDIFGTGMDRSWSDAPQMPVRPFGPAPTASSQMANGRPRPAGNPNDSFKHPEQPAMPRSNRNEPSSFKITETASEAGAYDPEDFAIGSTSARKARESAGNPVTGQGYDDSSTKTAKRYYQGTNTNQKLW